MERADVVSTPAMTERRRRDLTRRPVVLVGPIRSPAAERQPIDAHVNAVLRGDPATRSLSVVYLKQGKVVALDCVNMVKDYVHGKKLIEAGTQIAPELLSDAFLPLKKLAA